ncbi:AlpA family transcriptional regulator [uncultured Microbulbifer sp.]|uniref:helix-turn-helix transcriptional regulator n=1 Tax=uncultured Microbulbifer sp. TaxID=348147 RepID=UPI00260FBC66|nr:AlpA family phage regulatory protein [uncultured Microbulbifer sp.]
MADNQYNPAPLGFIRLPEVLKLLPISKSTWWAGVKSGRFPQSVKLGPRTTAWRAEDVYELVENLAKGDAI